MIFLSAGAGPLTADQRTNNADGLTIRVRPGMLAAQIGGVARTLLGMQVSREVEWPRELTPEAIERLEIRAAILATSVTTPEGVELTATP